MDRSIKCCARTGTGVWIPRTQVKNWVWWYSFHWSAGEEAEEASGGNWPASLAGSVRLTERLCLDKSSGSADTVKHEGCLWSFTCTCKYAHTLQHAYMNIYTCNKLITSEVK